MKNYVLPKNLEVFVVLFKVNLKYHQGKNSLSRVTKTIWLRVTVANTGENWISRFSKKLISYVDHSRG